MQSGKIRSHGPVNSQFPPQHYVSPTQGDGRSFDEIRNPPSLSRGRLPGPSNISAVSANQAVGQAKSPRSQSSSAAAVRSPVPSNMPLERRPSATQAYPYPARGHGVHQHARNASFVNSPATSPLSPQGLPKEYASMDNVYHGTPDLRPKDSPLTTVNGSSPLTPTSTIDKDNRENTHVMLTQRRVDRAPNVRPRRASHHRSNSRQQQQDQKTVGEYALHHLFTSFVGKADAKINQCVEDIGDSEPHVEEVCGPGADPDFDQLISALGHIARQKPKPLIDTVMYWRKSKGEAATHAKAELHQARSIQTTLSSLTHPMAEKLEDIIFGQLKNTEPESLHSTFRLANWKAFCQLLAVMSEMSLQSVSRRFTTDLRISQMELSGKGALNKDAENRMILMIWATRYLRVKVEPEAAWKESCELLYTLGEFFVDSHGHEIKHAYCQVLEQMILPVAAKSPASPAHNNRWRDFMNIVNTRLTRMLVKSQHWAVAFRLSATLLCVSPLENFASQWLSMIMSLPTRLKERTTRSSALQSVCRLVWTYLERINEPPGAIIRKLEDVMKIVFPSGKKSYLSTDPIFADPQVELLRIVGCRYPEFCFKSVIFPLMNADSFASGKDIKVEQLEPERIVIGIRASLAIIFEPDSAEARRPPFPWFSNLSIFEDAIQGPHGSRQALKTNSTSLFPGTPKTDSTVILNLDSSSRDYQVRFCEILGRITLICDETFGGQAVVDEKLGGLTPKTPIADTFSFVRTNKDDHAALADQKQGFYELLHVAVQALPRCLSRQIPLKSLINLLCTGTAHVNSSIAASSAQSLKAIAQHSHAQPVTVGFARFIFTFDARYSTMSDEGMLGPGHIEHTLRLYVELLQIWIEEIRIKCQDAAVQMVEDVTYGSRGVHLDLASVHALVDEIESHGVFFLCSQSRRVRSFAVRVLRLVTEFDSALGLEQPRIINLLEGDPQVVIDSNDEQLTVAERSRLQKGSRRSLQQNMLVELCSSEVSYDSTLWGKLFPNLMRLSFERCPHAVILGRDIVCTRLLQMQNIITNLAGQSRGLPGSTSDVNSARVLNRLGTTSSEVIIEQWKLYLIMACTTMQNAGAQTQSQLVNAQHSRKTSSKGSTQGPDKIASARSLFACVIPLLAAIPGSIRHAAVVALGAINLNLYRTLLESLQYAVTSCKEEAKLRVGNHQRTGSSPRRDHRTDCLRAEVTHVYRLTARFLREEAVIKDDWIVNNLTAYAKDLMIFLSDAEVQNDWQCQDLRRQFCGLFEELMIGLSRTPDPTVWIAFESRKSAFTLMEDWCGFSSNHSQQHNYQKDTRTHTLGTYQETEEKHQNAAIQIEKKNLRTAALSAMAAICIFAQGPDPKLQLIGRRALQNLIVHNLDCPFILEHAIEECYASKNPIALESYFEVATKILVQYPDYPLAFWRIVGAVLFTLGDETSAVRVKSARLLRTLEDRQQKSSKLQDFDISIADRTTAVYKLAQFEISKRLAKQHTGIAFHVFSQFSLHFRNAEADYQRNMIAAILPWVQAIELQLDPNGGPTAQSYMFLTNLIEITTKAKGALHNEIQALWQALATGPHGGNVQLVLDFVISLCLDRREQSFVDYAKQIIVYLSSTQAGQKVVEFLLLQITPKNMVQEKREPVVLPPDSLGLPYVAELSQALPIGHKQAGFSLGQLSLIFLVDLMVAPMKLGKESIPLLLQVILALWDHYNALVKEQAREMLVHLIHELVITKIDEKAANPKKESIEAFVESIRQHEAHVVWSYEECNGSTRGGDEDRVPRAMAYVTSQLLDFFAPASPRLQEQWPRIILNWATTCPVRHIACRSFQLFRCTLSSLDQPMLGDMLARLSNTIADQEVDVQNFSMEILTTLKTIIGALEPTDLLKYRQLFWATCACLHTVCEQEFREALGMLDKLLGKMDLRDVTVIKALEERKPEQWKNPFEGIAPLIHRGFKSESSLDLSLAMYDKLIQLPNSGLTGDGSRLLFGTLANLPRFLRCFDVGFGPSPESDIRSARTLIAVAEAQDHQEISMVLNAFVNHRYADSREFRAQLLSGLRRTFFPMWELKTLIFLIGLLTNRLHWYKTGILGILCAILPDIDTRRSEIASHGPDLISPLLRLLQTKYCPQALEVMDHIMVMTATPMDKHHMRMSMASSGSLKIRKEYEKTQSLYGIPEDTGWSVPMPATESEITRANMLSVFHSCASANTIVGAATPDIDFGPEDFNHDSYFSVERSEADGSAILQDEASILEGDMSSLVSKFDQLDEFFEGRSSTDDDHDRSYSGLTYTESYTDPDDGADLYDQQTAPILNKSLARTASISSLHNGFVDYRGPTPRDPRSRMGPSAKAPAGASDNPSLPLSRPTLHSRSNTSPANNITQAGIIDYLSSEDSEETLSEDERATRHGRPHMHSASHGAQQSGMRNIIPSGPSKQSSRKGMLRAQSRSKMSSSNSPEVPKVPEAYLQQSIRSAEP
ncbi:MAG: hypothetical protein Q9220_002839 [cf. Caloplaca sp. 1 TL-2023]